MDNRDERLIVTDSQGNVIGFTNRESTNEEIERQAYRENNPSKIYDIDLWMRGARWYRDRLK